MSIRTKALIWFKANYENTSKPNYTSKYYMPEESWPKKSVWWPQIPINIIRRNLNTDINIILETKPGAQSFYYLKVPSKFLLDNLPRFHVFKNKISLYLLTDPKCFLIEVRGEGKLDFSKFLVNNK